MKRDVAIVGAGYVGLPLARTFADAGASVLLVDVDAGLRHEGFGVGAEGGQHVVGCDFRLGREVEVLGFARPVEQGRGGSLMPVSISHRVDPFT